jgi:hypothetical protein
VISMALAQELKQAGLRWQPVEHDRFAIPDHGLDGKVFIISEFTALVQDMSGFPAITFHGAVEWALDYVLLNETVWLPYEEQLRQALEAALDAAGEPELALVRRGDGYECIIEQGRGGRSFRAADASSAYGAALLALLAAPL